MEIGFVDLIKGTETEDLKYLNDFLENAESYDVGGFRTMNSRSFVNLFGEYTFSKDNVLLPPETVYNEIKRLEKAKAKRENLKTLRKISQHFPFTLLDIPIQRGIKSVEDDMTAEEIEGRLFKDRIYSAISIAPGFLFLVASAFYGINGDIEASWKFTGLGSTYILADMATYIGYLAGKEGMYGYLLTEKEADNIF
ncbi:MAG: hypothetical protein KAS90_06475, partial [Candidatus Aenigmarchaeota archaeon]|nr:hypothetical protein [Candidatus Aenigmarchaeota archaeon]